VQSASAFIEHVVGDKPADIVEPERVRTISSTLAPAPRITSDVRMSGCARSSLSLSAPTSRRTPNLRMREISRKTPARRRLPDCDPISHPSAKGLRAVESCRLAIWPTASVVLAGFLSLWERDKYVDRAAALAARQLLNGGGQVAGPYLLERFRQRTGLSWVQMITSGRRFIAPSAGSTLGWSALGPIITLEVGVLRRSQSRRRICGRVTDRPTTEQ
jgi:hypothetical protein